MRGGRRLKSALHEVIGENGDLNAVNDVVVILGGEEQHVELVDIHIYELRCALEAKYQFIAIDIEEYIVEVDDVNPAWIFIFVNNHLTDSFSDLRRIIHRCNPEQQRHGNFLFCQVSAGYRILIITVEVLFDNSGYDIFLFLVERQFDGTVEVIPCYGELVAILHVFIGKHLVDWRFDDERLLILLHLNYIRIVDQGFRRAVDTPDLDRDFDVRGFIPTRTFLLPVEEESDCRCVE